MVRICVVHTWMMGYYEADPYNIKPENVRNFTRIINTTAMHAGLIRTQDGDFNGGSLGASKRRSECSISQRRSQMQTTANLQFSRGLFANRMPTVTIVRIRECWTRDRCTWRCRIGILWICGIAQTC
ncbi:hypothetical protein Zmor_026045 [Zophobas morio]|uniref:Uncharacterized protein n=1 Tax=Zophobas morio TaxID=2755281 RepID=A0AA38M4R0_9CUCU|nr:hypothetical protein Zmor_026045 [Zophobas morio]